MGLKPASTVLSPEEEAIAVAFRQHTQLPLDDFLYALQATLLVAVDRTSKVAFADLQPKATKAIAAEFLRRVIAALPYKSAYHPY